MGFLKELGSFVGEVTGGVVGGTVNVIGELTGSEFIEEIGDDIKKASSFAGDKLGEAASGTWLQSKCVKSNIEILIDYLFGYLVRSGLI